MVQRTTSGEAHNSGTDTYHWNFYGYLAPLEGSTMGPMVFYEHGVVGAGFLYLTIQKLGLEHSPNHDATCEEILGC